MHAPLATDSDRLERLARYIAHGVPPTQAGEAVGCSASRVSQLLADEQFLLIVQKFHSEVLEKYVDINRMYDDIEKTALKNILDVQQFNSDPDLNVKLAMMANRATRRGEIKGHENTPLSARAADERIAINFNFKFINNVQNGGVDTAKETTIEAKEMNMASPAVVNEILGNKSGDDDRKKKKGLSDFFAPVDV